MVQGETRCLKWERRTRRSTLSRKAGILRNPWLVSKISHAFEKQIEQEFVYEDSAETSLASVKSLWRPDKIQRSRSPVSFLLTRRKAASCQYITSLRCHGSRLQLV